MEELTYFLDDSFDEVIPLAAKTELVDDYEKLLQENDADAELIRFDTKQELLDFAIELSRQAHNGGTKFEELSDEGMKELIDEVSIDCLGD